MPLILAGTIGSNTIAACLFTLWLLSCTYYLNSPTEFEPQIHVLAKRSPPRCNLPKAIAVDSYVLGAAAG